MIISKYMRKLTREFMVKRNVAGYYPLAASCQIEGLTNIYEQYFGRKSNGTFIEVGAFDGEYVSNTSGLADIGWKGIYIEPVPEFYERCKERHRKNKNITVMNVAVGAEKGTAKMHVGGPLSTAEPKVKSTFSKLNWAKASFVNSTECSVDVEALNSLLEREGVVPGFDLLVVDVEGYEWNVLQGFNVEYWSPKMIIIELHDQNDDYWAIREECMQIVKYLDMANYKVIWKDFTNTVYVPADSFPIEIGSR